MSANIEHSSLTTGESLCGGIVGDLQHLVGQQLELKRQEIETDLHRHTATEILFALGMGAYFVDAVIACLLLIYFWQRMVS